MNLESHHSLRRVRRLPVGRRPRPISGSRLFRRRHEEVTVLVRPTGSGTGGVLDVLVQLEDGNVVGGVVGYIIGMDVDSGHLGFNTHR